MKTNPCGDLGAQLRSSLLGGAVMAAGLLAVAPSVHAQAANGGRVAVVGNQPLKGATIKVYAAGTSGYGSATLIATGATDGKGRIKFNDDDSDIECPDGNPQIYLVALGGVVSNGFNKAIGLSAALGPCNRIPSSYTVDEVTTLAAVYSLAQFLSADGTQAGTSATNVTGLKNAVATTHNLVQLSHGLAATALVAGANGTPPTATVNTLGDVLAAANSARPGSAPITKLFAAATPPGGVAPTTTLQAALDIARNPANSVSAIFNLASGDTTYTPVLSSAPNDWTLGIDFSGGTVLGANTRVGSIGVDGAGKVWFAAYASDGSINGGNGFIANLSSVGVPSAAYMDNANVASPFALAIDGSGNVFVPNSGTGTVSGIKNSGSSLTGSPFSDGGLVSPNLIAVEGSGNVVVGASAGLTELSASSGYTATSLTLPVGTFAPIVTALGINGNANVFAGDGDNQALLEVPSGSFADPGLVTPAGLAFDTAANGGNAWVGNTQVGISEFVASSGYITANDYSNNSATGVLGLAIDSSGNVWAANTDSSGNVGVVELSNNGTQIGNFISAGGAFANANSADNVALDASGNVWVAGDNNHVIELVGASAPVKTPAIEQPKLP